MTDQNKPAEDDRAIRFMVISRAFDFAKQLVSAGTYIAITYIGYLAIVALAGKTTIANIVLKYLTAAGSDYGIPWFVAGFCTIWALLERKLRKRKTQSLQGRIMLLEERIDPGRTTSGLLPSGDTNPEDRNL